MVKLTDRERAQRAYARERGYRVVRDLDGWIITHGGSRTEQGQVARVIYGTQREAWDAAERKAATFAFGAGAARRAG